MLALSLGDSLLGGENAGFAGLLFCFLQFRLKASNLGIIALELLLDLVQSSVGFSQIVTGGL